VAACLAGARAGCECTMVFPVSAASPAGVDVASQALVSAGARVRTFPLNHRLFAARARRWAVSTPMLAWLVRNVGRYDVIHAHCGWNASTLVALLAARLGGRHSVLTPHESLTAFDVRKSNWPARVLKRAIRALYLRTVDLFVFASEIERTESIPGKRVRSVVLAHAIDAPVRREQRQPWRTGAPLRIGFLGRFDAKKNLDLLLEVAAELPWAELHIAGGGDVAIESRLRAQAEALRLGDRARWLGFLTGEPRESFFASIDLLAMPSAFECFGMASAEAIVRGVPVLVSPMTGIADLVERHGCGLVVPVEVSGMCHALEALHLDPGGLAELAVRTGAAASELSSARHGEQLRSAYEGRSAAIRLAVVGQPTRVAA
jgi:glycosyltransferase involved in cell wall biosynthesis